MGGYTRKRRWKRESNIKCLNTIDSTLECEFGNVCESTGVDRGETVPIIINISIDSFYNHVKLEIVYVLRGM